MEICCYGNMRQAHYSTNNNLFELSSSDNMLREQGLSSRPFHRHYGNNLCCLLAIIRKIPFADNDRLRHLVIHHFWNEIVYKIDLNPQAWNILIFVSDQIKNDMLISLKYFSFFMMGIEIHFHLPIRLELKNTPSAPLQRGKTPPRNECPRYDTKQSDGEVPVMPEFGECGAHLHCHRAQVHSGPQW